MAKGFQLVEGKHSTSAICPVCGIVRIATNIRTHVAKAALYERSKMIYDKHDAFYQKNTIEEVIVRRKWKI